MTFIRDSVCISPQKTFDGSLLDVNIVDHHGKRYEAIEPDYTGVIPASALRRMGKAVRMGVAAGTILLRRNAPVEAIIIGTANGGLEDCIKFLNQIVEYEEGTLTPTNFVQSTPNSVAGNLAVLSKNTCYNITHVNKGLAFEAALLDALLLLETGKADSVLLGAVEEISDYNFNIDTLSGMVKHSPGAADDLLKSGTPGSVVGEGVTMFLLERGTQSDDGALLDVEQVSYPTQEILLNTVSRLLTRNKLTPEDVGGLILGYSGDSRSDDWYDFLQSSLFPGHRAFSFKNLVGDYATASGFALWQALQIANDLHPTNIVLNAAEGKKNGPILIYNHYNAIQHGFILLKTAHGNKQGPAADIKS